MDIFSYRLLRSARRSDLQLRLRGTKLEAGSNPDSYFPKRSNEQKESKTGISTGGTVKKEKSGRSTTGGMSKKKVKRAFPLGGMVKKEKSGHSTTGE